MGKRSRRPAREARDVHMAIRAAAESLKTSERCGFRDASELPEISDLLHAARDAVASGVPRSLVFHGRQYWLRVRLAAQFDIFAAPGDAEPLLIGASFSTDEHGHRPGH